MRTGIAIGVLGCVGAFAPPAAGQSGPLGENGTGAMWGTPVQSQVAGSELGEAARLHSSITVSGRGYAAGGAAQYQVRSGDTLWDICSAQFSNPWLWPEVWSLNPEITNPHWIYPGQVIRLRLGAPRAYGWGEPQAITEVSGGTVFFRNEGFIEKELEDPPGTIVASWEDEMLLSYPDLLYVRFREDFPVQEGQQYTIYRPREQVEDFVEDEEGDPVVLGRLVEILGTGTVATWDPDAHLARVRIIEAVNPVERGDSVGPIERNFFVSAPRAAEVDLDGQIVATLRPRLNQGEGFIVFINRGYDDGVRDGNRFQVIRATDHYLQSRRRDVPPDLPFEWIGECQVLEARKTASTCLVLESRLELAIGDRVTLIRGQ
jgi:hypothetical protein